MGRRLVIQYVGIVNESNASFFVVHPHIQLTLSSTAHDVRFHLFVIKRTF